MPGHQTKYVHITDRTYLRPRDIIQFSNEVLKQYKQRAKNGVDEQKFINQDINYARQDYSNYFYEELDDEIHKHIPEYKQYFEIFKTIGKVQFDRTDYIVAFNKRHELFPDISDPIIILKSLFDFSVIGFYKAGGLGYGGSEYIFKYIDRKAQFDSSADRFRVHLGLMEVLNLKRY
jgi:signal peptidase I